LQLTFGERVPGLEARAFDENEVRAAAGLTMVTGAVAFCFAYFNKNYAPLQAVTTFFFAEFLIRLVAGLRASPMGLVSRALTTGRPPEWVSARPKRLAWTIGLGMSFAMMIITNSGIRGTLPRTMCLICLTMMWLESVLGFCVGCELHRQLALRGWVADDPEFEVCAGGRCEIR
jgi:hypothetical protein